MQKDEEDEGDREDRQGDQHRAGVGAAQGVVARLASDRVGQMRGVGGFRISSAGCSTMTSARKARAAAARSGWTTIRRGLPPSIPVPG